MAISGVPWPGNVALPSDLLHAIGHVAAIWAQMEFRIDGTIRHALDQPKAPKIKTTLAIRFDERLKLLVRLLPDFLPKKEIDEWPLAFIAEVNPLHSRRNLIVHGAVGNSAQKRKGETAYWFRRVHWESPARIIEKRLMTVAEVEQVAVDISNLIAIAALLGDWARP